MYKLCERIIYTTQQRDMTGGGVAYVWSNKPNSDTVMINV